jgi:hypothetical protein
MSTSSEENGCRLTANVSGSSVTLVFDPPFAARVESLLVFDEETRAFVWGIEAGERPSLGEIFKRYGTDVGAFVKDFARPVSTIPFGQAPEGFKEKFALRNLVPGRTYGVSAIGVPPLHVLFVAPEGSPDA